MGIHLSGSVGLEGSIFRGSMLCLRARERVQWDVGDEDEEGGIRKVRLGGCSTMCPCVSFS